MSTSILSRGEGRQFQKNWLHRPMHLTCKTKQAQTHTHASEHGHVCIQITHAHTHNQEWTFYCVKCVKVHHWKLWLSWDGYCFRSSENTSMITVTYLSLSLSRVQWCVLWPLYSCTGGVWWKRPPSSAIRKLWFSVSYRLYLWMELCRCCLQWLWQTDNLSLRKSRIQRETCSPRVNIWEPQTQANVS